MKATELRIGNKLFDYAGREITVRCISIPLQLKEYFVGCNENHSNYTMDELKPIPLTEEWLLKFGFGRYKDSEYKARAWTLDDRILEKIGVTAYHFYMLKTGGKFQARTGWMDSCGLRYIQYVHQLQNLYFALTGEELIIN
ncbi:MAG TPA: hypothetical protein VMV77_04645 [Bacteroidales bacterium]|nr:hypothetical protein [Bacteroidales bacterium]